MTAKGSWIVASLMAKLLWTASSDANLSHFEIRFCAGPNYSTDNESVIGAVLPNAPLESLTNVGLANPGNIAGYKIYAITTTGNERGSNTVTVTRP